MRVTSQAMLSLGTQMLLYNYFSINQTFANPSSNLKQLL